MSRLLLDTAGEGPLALNDNAFEVCRDFLAPQGDRFFRQVNRYGHYLTDIRNLADYQAGDILKLILPFLKAAGLTNAQLAEHCLKTLKLMPGAEAAYHFMHRRGYPMFQISAGYRQFAAAVGLKLGFDEAHIFCTELDLDRYRLSSAEAEELRRLQEEIAAAPEIELPPGAASLTDLAVPVQEAVGRLDQIFFETIPSLKIGAIYQEVHTVGGPEKARAVSESLENSGFSLAEVIYVGDGSSDVPAFEAVRAGGGLTIAFNGDRRAVGAAEVVVFADTAWPIAMLAAVFELWGKEGVLEVAAPETRQKSRALVLPEQVIEPIVQGLEGGQFNLYRSNPADLDRLARESLAMRARLRGDAIAAGS